MIEHNDDFSPFQVWNDMVTNRFAMQVIGMFVKSKVVGG
jgi:hypothetical protein